MPAWLYLILGLIIGFMIGKQFAIVYPAIKENMLRAVEEDNKK
jgi:uncharacterized membrane-anchored protein YhcB (DUF1043 family)